MSEQKIMKIGTTATISMRWHRWSPDNDVPFKRERARGNGEERLAHELELMGVPVWRVDDSKPYDIDGDLGRIQVKAPDKMGKIVTAKHGYASMTWLFDECQWVYRLAGRVLSGNVDPPMDPQLQDIGERLQTRTTTVAFWERMMDVITIMHLTLDGDSLHEWVSDPHLFQADCCSVFASEAIDADVLALVCEDGYSLSAKRDLDLLFHFRGDVWNGRPKFTCDDATAVNRKKKLTKIPTTKFDKIADIERLRGLQAKARK